MIGMHLSRIERVLFLLMLLLPVVVKASHIPMVRIEAKRLPDMNIPRSGHQAFIVNGELTVVGGHTNGFVPTQTAEYLKDGEWHTIPMIYTHDTGFSVVLKSGKVLLGGGCEQPLGIGQTFSAELYDPETHTFRGFGILQLKRAWNSAIELDSGQVVIAGNWYHTDGIELFNENQIGDGDYKEKSSFTYIKDVAVQRCKPYIFRMAGNDALIMGSYSSRGDTLYCTFAERLKGDTVHIPLLESWQPMATGIDAMNLIGDESKGDFTYLMPVQDSKGQVAIARVCGTDISLLPTACPIPMECQGDEIEYFTGFIADRQAGRAYMMGMSRNYKTELKTARIYILGIDYTKDTKGNGMPLTLYYIDSYNVVPDCVPVLTPEGNLLIVGGMVGNSNFTPSKEVWLLRLGGEPEAASWGIVIWMWLLAILLVVIVSFIVLTVVRRRKTLTPVPSKSSANAELMDRICQMMEQEHLFLNPDLKITDIADRFGVHRNYISDCINSERGCSFTQFVNAYRVEHAKRLLRQYPDKTMTAVCAESGFASETSFFRNFKQLTGMKPKKWAESAD